MPGPLSAQGRQKALIILAAAVLLFGVGVSVRTVRVAREIGQAGTYDHVRAILVRRLGVNPARVRPAASLATGLQLDSQARTEFVLALEEEFDIQVPEGVAASLVTVQDAVHAVDRLRAARSRR
jgi:acyl carrier protein